MFLSCVQETWAMHIYCPVHSKPVTKTSFLIKIIDNYSQTTSTPHQVGDAFLLKFPYITINADCFISITVSILRRLIIPREKYTSTI